ncbi:MAG: tetratricopeptide repeat protein [Alphaproteobacteria bacterium]|nr:tetratricopeptide repeat protein [Alphaproteobacteria bacterium]
MTIAQQIRLSHVRLAARLAALATAGMMLGACAQNGASLGLGLAANDEPVLADAGASEMDKALNYWGQKYAKAPADKEAALNYAKNLKAAGRSKQAFLILQQASVMHGNDREIASEYGRLALEHGQVELANKLLALADDQTQPDWRVVSGRGAALARLGKYSDAIAMFERAHELAPSNPSVLNNLAMAHAGNGDLKQAETLLRRAADNPMARDKVSKNLVLVLNLQGRKAEADALAKGASAIQTASITRPSEKK